MTRSRPRRPADRRAHGHLTAYGRHGHGPGYGYRYGYGYGYGYGASGVTEARRPYRAQRRDRRRERRMRRRHGAGGVVVLGLAMVLGGMVAVAGLTVVLVRVLVELLPFLFLLAVLGGAFVLVRRSVWRSPAAEPDPVAAPAAPQSPREAWHRAKADFDRLRAEYAAHECDPMQVLRRPALSDVSVPSTARFVDAFAEAQALDTDAHPGAPYDAGYTVAVARAQQAWRAAQDAADRIRLSNVPQQERGSIERVLKLLTTARDSDSEPERLAAYARARAELDRLDRAGIVHLPRTARAALDEAARGALPG